MYNNIVHETKRKKPTVWVLRSFIEDEGGPDSDGGCTVWKHKPTADELFPIVKEDADWDEEDEADEETEEDIVRETCLALVERGRWTDDSGTCYMLEELPVN